MGKLLGRLTSKNKAKSQINKIRFGIRRHYNWYSEIQWL
jgi:hypothetical protein